MGGNGCSKAPWQVLGYSAGAKVAIVLVAALCSASPIFPSRALPACIRRRLGCCSRDLRGVRPLWTLICSHAAFDLPLVALSRGPRTTSPAQCG